MVRMIQNMERLRGLTVVRGKQRSGRERERQKRKDRQRRRDTGATAWADSNTVERDRWTERERRQQ